MRKPVILTIFGTRPEAIKMAPLVKAIENTQDLVSKVCVTAQHRQMLDQVLEIFNINPDYDLNIMKEGQTLSGITNLVLDGVEKVLKELKPDMVLVHGDTTTTFAAALASFYCKIPVGHVEAGLRTFDKYFPFPEEMNRKLTGCIADIHFSPTRNNFNNLVREGVNPENIYITGNTAIDALKSTVSDNYEFENEFLRKVDFRNKRVITVTAHRRENLGQPLKNICHALKEIVRKYEGDVEIVYPVHLNPQVQGPVREILGEVPGVHLIDPVQVLDMHNLLSRSYLVLTDSGGLQEEAPSLGKPVLVLRNETERPEAVEAGTVKVVGTEKENIIEEASRLLEDENEYRRMAHSVNPYGDGHASERIVGAVRYWFGLTDKKPEPFI
ncbi:UDP-N-acetyl glucosamine 2-epimerase [Thermoclostridium stercorarium subsp. thermolacticum DSM 2910]|uniref:UDP-N-acetylglucosamine 2-epimerase (non-hydrolyzing) n=1 Tax=Thermoclostridium stercorarium subsp. thermolacticum DSM 2910 TaxID=1121336 RepID=A0A1B1YG63_THEST|nr:UDP-N-acetylglucosamine 2-epimerase (non-hydrolyzing) [Thermoclostridium stercorarium]ANW99748.1 UDP-N-acetyl glucosamine 2-epimerase [Thermoclostridium stercorarium subsp. thermolacticum DSM 2910]